MASEVEIVNSALRKIGADPITSLTEGSDNANVALDLYEIHRDNLLRYHTWNFATKRKKLSRSATTPVYQWDYQYPVPSDFLRIVEVHDNTDGLGAVRYRMEHDSTDGTVIRTNSTDVWLTYIYQVTDPNRMPIDFRETLALTLASEFATAIQNSNTLSERLLSQATRARTKARSNDGTEDYPNSFPEGSWVTSRFRNGL